jgi:hypothetical protein
MELNNQALATTADVIAIGRALDSRSVWEGRVLVTQVTVRVEETLKGGADETVVVTLPGGIDANRRIPVSMTYAGAPTMHAGERVFLFLARDDENPDRLTVIGFSQGKFSVNTEPGGEEIVERDLSQVRLAGGAGVVRGSRNRVPLNDFKRVISGYLAGQ